MEQHKTILAIGDSNTYGTGVNRDETYPAQLERKLLSNEFGYKVINCGVNGNTTNDGLNSLQHELADHNPELVIMLFGVADLRKGYSVDEIYSNFSKMIELSKNNGASIILVGYKNPDDVNQNKILHAIASKGGVPLSDEFFDMYARLSKDHHIDLIPDFLDGILGVEGTMQNDNYSHLTEKGYQIFVERLYPIVIKSLSKNGR